MRCPAPCPSFGLKSKDLESQYRWQAAEETVGVERLGAVVFAVAEFARCAVGVHVERAQDGSVDVPHRAACAVLMQAPVAGRGVAGLPTVSVAAWAEVCDRQRNRSMREVRTGAMERKKEEKKRGRFVMVEWPD